MNINDLNDYDLQLIVDKEIYLESERQKKDVSGQLSFCKYCALRNSFLNECAITYEGRSKHQCCARAKRLEQKSQKF